MEARSLTRARRRNLIYKYRKSKRALFLLDYDGTLAPFNSRPELVFPDSELKKILAKLNKNTKNSLIIFALACDVYFQALGDVPIIFPRNHGCKSLLHAYSWEPSIANILT